MIKKISLCAILTILMGINISYGKEAFPRYVGGDVSLLPDYESAKAIYKDASGKTIPDLLKFCYDEGMNCMRVRLFVDPANYSGPEKDANAKQDLAYIIPLCKKIQETGLDLMLDFHYSDTWADPAKQWTPKAWEGLSDMELYQKIYDYTKETLETLKENGIVPEFIQPGNEISYGMLWGPAGTGNKKVHVNSDSNWSRFHTLLRKAVQACREVCPDAKIIIHTERVAQVWYLTEFYSKFRDKYKLDYDIIGLSYYPYFHGDITVLDDALTALEENFPDKNIMIVETGYPYAWEVPGTTVKDTYPISEAGQNQFAQDVVNTLLKHNNVDGLFWWWFEYNAYNTKLSGWYNAPLFDSRTGKVTKAFETICSYGTGHDTNGIQDITSVENTGSDIWYDLQGRRLTAPTQPGLYIHNGKKVIIR